MSLARGLSLVVSLLLFAAAVVAQEPAENLAPSEVAARVQEIPEGTAGNVRLQRLAEAYQKALADGEAEVATAKEKLETATDEEKPALEKTIADWPAREKRLAKSLEQIVDVMAKRGMDVKDLRVFLTDYGIFAADVDAALGLLDKWFNKIKDWVVDEGPGILAKFVLFLVILFAFKILANVLSKITRGALSASRLKVSALLREFFGNVVGKITFFVGLIIALDTIGIGVGPLLAGIGVLGFVVGFALQETLANFAAGIMILLYRPYDVGDVVSAAGVTGKVEAMSLVSTTVGLFDNQVVIVPNGKIWGDVITNITARDKRRVDMTFGVSYSDDLDKVEKLLNEIVTGHPKVLQDPAPVIKMHQLADSSVNFICRPWSKTGDYWDVYWDIHKTVKQRFDAEGISIPFPQRDVHLYQETEGGGAK